MQALKLESSDKGKNMLPFSIIPHTVDIKNSTVSKRPEILISPLRSGWNQATKKLTL